MVEKLLQPQQDGANEHKLLQLRELAEINGAPQRSAVAL